MYKSLLDNNETEHAIKLIKDTFEKLLSGSLHLRRVTAPLFVKSSSGLNDTLNGDTNPVSFNVPALDGEQCEIVHSLAKWKRMKLGELGIEPGEGIYTDMNAIRPCEELDELHSMYVDQWDWEQVITETNWKNGGITTMSHVFSIYDVIKSTYYVLCEHYPALKNNEFLPPFPSYTTSELLANQYPNLTPKEREYEFCKERKAIFIAHIGGDKHDGMRAPDYDDWDKNGDLLIWSPAINKPIEITSMGVRVNAESLHKQLEYTGHLDWENYEYHKKILNNELPLTIGGGIGQSRLCMLLLQKQHIGEVQCSVWSNDTLDDCRQKGINLLQ